MEYLVVLRAGIFLVRRASRDSILESACFPSFYRVRVRYDSLQATRERQLNEKGV